MWLSLTGDRAVGKAYRVPLREDLLIAGDAKGWQGNCGGPNFCYMGRVLHRSTGLVRYLPQACQNLENVQIHYRVLTVDMATFMALLVATIISWIRSR